MKNVEIVTTRYGVDGNNPHVQNRTNSKTKCAFISCMVIQSTKFQQILSAQEELSPQYYVDRWK